MRPSGTVTFLMSDIEGSTRLLRTLGVDRYEAALQAHRTMLRAAFAHHAGFEVGVEGDSLFVAFCRAQDAVHAAVDAQCALAGHRWQEVEPIRVRIGIHTCECRMEGRPPYGVRMRRRARARFRHNGRTFDLTRASRDAVARNFETTRQHRRMNGTISASWSFD
jgi:hypothetical protein